MIMRGWHSGMLLLFYAMGEVMGEVDVDYFKVQPIFQLWETLSTLRDMLGRHRGPRHQARNRQRYLIFRVWQLDGGADRYCSRQD